MNRITSFLSNTILATFFITLILVPVGIVGGIGGVGSKPQRGAALGAKLNEQGGTLSEVRDGKIKEISFTTFWGSRAVYQNILNVKNEGASEKEYLLEILEVNGTDTEKQDILVYFRGNGMPKIKLEPGEVRWINLNVTAPENIRPQTQSALILAIWEH